MFLRLSSGIAVSQVHCATPSAGKPRTLALHAEGRLLQPRASLLDRLWSIGAPGLSRLRVESAIGAEAAARIALHEQLLNELMNRKANLLCYGAVDRELLRKLSENRNDVLWIVRGRLAAKSAQQRVVCKIALRQRAVQVRGGSKRVRPVRIRRERILRERICLPTKAKGKLRAEGRLSGFVTE
jgi:hypothetical protein